MGKRSAAARSSSSLSRSSAVAARRTVALLETLEGRTLLAAQTFSLAAAADAYVRDGSYATANFGASTELQLKRTTTANSGSNRYVHLRFDLSSVPTSVASAKLRIHGRIDTATQTPQVAVYPASGAAVWGEDAITWNNQPAVAAGAAPLSSVVVATSTRKWYEWDVSGYLASAKASGQSEVGLVLRSLTVTTPHMIFSSGEAAENRPELLVTTEDAPPPPPPQAIVVSNTQLSIGEGASKALGVSLASQPAGEVVVNIAKDSTGDADVNLVGGGATGGVALTFTPANWNVAQNVLISVSDDDDSAAGSATFTLTSSGLTDKSVVVTEIDDDAAPATLTLRPTADAHVRDGSSAALNFGSSAELHLKRSTAAGSSREIYLKFDLSGVSSIISATLGLHGLIHSSTQTAQVAVYAVGNTTWAESGLTWNNRPQVAGGAAPLASTVVATSTAKWYEFDLMNHLAAEKSAGRNVVTLVVRSLTSTEPYLIFKSDEAAADGPRLVVTQTANPGPPPTPSEKPTITAAGDGLHAVRIGAGRVTLPSGTVVNVAGGVLTLDAPQITQHGYDNKNAPANYAGQAPNLRWPDSSANLVPAVDTLVLGGLYHSVIPESVVVRNAGGTVMTRDVDYKLNTEWGQVLNLSSRLGTPGSAKISISYKIVRQRLDLIQVLPDGSLSVKKGTSAVVCPTLPDPDFGAVPLAGVYVFTIGGAKSGGFVIEDRQIFPINPAAPTPVMNPGAIPTTLGKLASGQSVNIAYFGDSITDGAEAGHWWSDRSKTYTSLVTNGLRARFPGATITETLASEGGRGAVDSQHVFQSRVLNPHNAGNRIDLVVISMGMNDRAKPSIDPFKAAMTDYINQARAVGIEVLLVTPMQLNEYYEPAILSTQVTRLAIANAIKEVAAAKNATLVDVHTEWMNQATRGIAPISQLHNMFNHPGVEGMKVYANAILRAFPTT